MALIAKRFLPLLALLGAGLGGCSSDGGEANQTTPGQVIPGAAPSVGDPAATGTNPAGPGPGPGGFVDPSGTGPMGPGDVAEPPAVGTDAPAASGTNPAPGVDPSMPSMPGDPSMPTPGDPTATKTLWINAQGHIDAAGNSFGIQGDWYAYGDGTTSTQSGNPYSDGKYCVTGTADGASDHWGVGIGLDLNNTGDKQPYEFSGKLTGFRIKFTGQVPAEARLNFVIDPDLGVNPFIGVTLGESVVYSIADAQVPFSWDVDNAGQRVDSVLYSIQVLAPGDSAAGPIELCIEEFEPIFDAAAAPGGTQGTTFINSDGFVTADSNTYGVQGPIYAISDGNSTTQSGVPFEDGKYCVRGEFSGNADDWGAGIAFDLNHAPGADKQPFTPAGKVDGFRIGLSGNTPGSVRIQYVLNEPAEGDQPFLVGMMNQTAFYPISWAQVPTSWEVDNAGLEVGDSLYTVQVYLDGSEPGPFEVCVEDLAPILASEFTYMAPAAAAGYQGSQTIDPSLLAAEYAKWTKLHLQDCGDGSACVPREEGDCISEGVGYGMLLSVGNDDQTNFDKLWAYYSKNENGSGLMKWQTAACGASMNDGSATDGDLDAAMALIQAGCKWGGTYQDDAKTLINAISTSAVATCGSGAVLKPGNGFGGCMETDPSYIAPAYFKVFGSLTNDSVWQTLTDTGYQLLEANQTRKNGAFSDWSSDSGGTSAGSHSDDFGPDASRVPWRLATDYVWNGEARATALLDKFAAYVDAQGGPARAFTPNSNYRGGSAFSVIHKDAATAAKYRDAWLMTSADDDGYFPGTLRVVYMLLAANQFPQACN